MDRAREDRQERERHEIEAIMRSVAALGLTEKEQREAIRNASSRLAAAKYMAGPQNHNEPAPRCGIFGCGRRR